MPPRRRAATPIPIDVESVRRRLTEGKIVRVGISRSAQFPDGGVGRVRRVGDPSVDGEEYILVELSLNGTKDTLPFTPADLTPATRASTVAAPAIVPRPKPTRSATAKTIAPQPDREPPTHPAARRAVADTDSLFPDTRPAPDTSHSENVVTSPAPPAITPDAPAAPTTAKPRATRGAPRRPPAVAITIATTDTEPPQWRIEAKVGARVVLRSGAVAPARVWELVGMLDDPTLIRAVGTILDEQRKAAQARADALTAELAQVRAELEALPDAQA